MKKIDLNEKANFLKAKEINFGIGARECIKNLKKCDMLSSQDLQVYMNECVILLLTLRQNYLIGVPGICHSEKCWCSESKTHSWCGNSLAWDKNESDSLTFAQLNILSFKDSDKALEQYFFFLEHVKKMHLNELKLFDASETDSDFFYFHELWIETKKQEQFAFVFKVILTLGHGQAAVERSF